MYDRISAVLCLGLGVKRWYTFAFALLKTSHHVNKSRWPTSGNIWEKEAYPFFRCSSHPSKFAETLSEFILVVSASSKTLDQCNFENDVSTHVVKKCTTKPRQLTESLEIIFDTFFSHHVLSVLLCCNRFLIQKLIPEGKMLLEQKAKHVRWLWAQMWVRGRRVMSTVNRD